MNEARHLTIKGEEWERTDLFCPFCGEHSVVREPGEGDYYVGPAHRCTACDSDFHLA